MAAGTSRLPWLRIATLTRWNYETSHASLHWLLLVAVLACKQVLFIHSELCLILVIVRSVAAQALRNTLQLCDKLQERPVLDNSFEVRLVLA